MEKYLINLTGTDMYVNDDYVLTHEEDALVFTDYQIACDFINYMDEPEKYSVVKVN